MLHPAEVIMTVLTRRLSVAFFGLILAVGASSGNADAEPPPKDVDYRAEANFERYPLVEVFASADHVSVRIILGPPSVPPTPTIHANTRPTAGQLQFEETLRRATLSVTMWADFCVFGSCPPHEVRQMTVNLTWTAIPEKPFNSPPGEYKVQYSDPPECIEHGVFHAVIKPAIVTGSVIIDGTDYTAGRTGQGDLARLTARQTDRYC
jgi:hypothetical protein